MYNRTWVGWCASLRQRGWEREVAYDGHGGDWGIEQRAALLAVVRPFDRLDDATRRSVAARCRARPVERGAIIFVAGQPAEAVHVLAEGEVRVVRETDDGREVILRLIRPGELFGGAGGWGVDRYPATTIAAERSVVVTLAASAFADLIHGSSDFALAVIRELGARLRDAETRIQELQTERVERRIARMLLRLANRMGQRTDRGITIDATLSRQAIADLCGTTLSTASRVLSGWDRDGILIAGREHVIIVRPHDLVAIADDIADST